MPKLRSLKKLRNRGKGKQQSILGNLYSKSEKLFLDSLESIYNVKIERQFMLGARFYDGRFGQHLIEVDGVRWHSTPKDLARDALKNRIASKFGFQIHRIILNKTSEVPATLEENKQLLDEIFNGSNQKPKVPSSEKQD